MDDSVGLESRSGPMTTDGGSGLGVAPGALRAGDPAALQALVDRRGPAVVAFCTQVCGPSAAPTAAAEAFARFRAALRDMMDLVGGDVDVDRLVRSATRHAAATMARTPVGPPPHGRLMARNTETCQRVATMLAARANSALNEADLDRLARHLNRCERCSAMSEIFHRAELAYQDPPFDTLGTDVSSVLLEALSAVSPDGVGVGPAPGPHTPVSEPLDGAFGHLPDLEDEVPLPEEPAATPAEAAAPVVGAPPEAPEPDAEPEPEDAAEPEAEHDAAQEWTYEFDPVAGEPDAEAEAPAEAEAEPDVERHLAALPDVAAAPRQGRRRRARALRIGIPTALVAVAVALGFALTGGDSPTPVTSTPPAIHVRKPVLTPLPVTVAAPAADAGGATTP